MVSNPAFSDVTKQLFYYKNILLTLYLNCFTVLVGISRALQGFVMFLVIVALLGLFIFLFKHYRYQIYLGCRDCCSSSKNDG